MSRFWAEPVRLHLHAEACELAVGGQTQRLALASGAQPWPAALAEQLPQRAKVSVCVADHWLRYLVVRWPAAVRARREREAWLAHQFKTVHGIDMAAWTIAMDTAPVDDARIVCAAPTALIDGLNGQLAARKARLASFTGAFIAQFNRLHRHCPAADGALLCAADGRLTLGVWRAGQWTALRSQMVAAGDAEAPRRMLTQLWATGEAAPVGVLYALGSAPTVPDGWQPMVLETAA